MNSVPSRNGFQRPPGKLLAMAGVILALLAGAGYLIYKRTDGPQQARQPVPPPKPVPSPAPGPAVAPPAPAPSAANCDGHPFPEKCKDDLKNANGGKQ